MNLCNYIKVNILAVFCLLLFTQCAMKPRYGYDRNRGTYAKPSQSSSAKKAVAFKSSKSSTKVSSNSTVSTSNKTTTKVSHKSKSLNSYIKPWLGTPYKYGGTTKRGVDCSGFVSNVMKDWKNIYMPRSTSDAWKVGKSISKRRLIPGDVIYFGNIWGVSHSGIYIGNNKFAHASSSKGVIYTNIDDAYWKPKYKGARRYY